MVMALNLAKVYKKTKGNFSYLYEIAFRLNGRTQPSPLLVAIETQCVKLPDLIFQFFSLGRLVWLSRTTEQSKFACPPQN